MLFGRNKQWGISRESVLEDTDWVNPFNTGQTKCEEEVAVSGDVILDDFMLSEIIDVIFALYCHGKLELFIWLSKGDYMEDALKVDLLAFSTDFTTALDVIIHMDTEFISALNVFVLDLIDVELIVSEFLHLVVETSTHIEDINRSSLHTFTPFEEEVTLSLDSFDLEGIIPHSFIISLFDSVSLDEEVVFHLVLLDLVKVS